MSTLFWGLEPSDPQEIDRCYEDLHIPSRPGDLLTGLVSIKNQVLQGRMDAREMVDALEEKDAWMSRVFGHLAVEITPGDVPAVYASGVAQAAADIRRHLENILILLRAGLSEMRAFAEDSDPTHLDNGLVLAAKGEHETIDLMALLGDYQRHPISLMMRGGTFIAQLSAARLEGTVSAEGMGRILAEYVAETRTYFDSAMKNLTEAATLLQTPGPESMTGAMRRLRAAQMEAWRALANLQGGAPN